MEEDEISNNSFKITDRSLRNENNFNKLFIKNFNCNKFCYNLILEIIQNTYNKINNYEEKDTLIDNTNKLIKNEIKKLFEIQFKDIQNFDNKIFIEDIELENKEIDNWGCNKIKLINHYNKNYNNFCNIKTMNNLNNNKNFIKQEKPNKNIKLLRNEITQEIKKEEKLLRIKKEQEIYQNNLNKKNKNIIENKKIDVIINIPLGSYTYNVDGSIVEFKKKNKIKQKLNLIKTENINNFDELQKNINIKQTDKYNIPNINKFDKIKISKKMNYKENFIIKSLKPSNGVIIDVDNKFLENKENKEDINNDLCKLSINEYNTLKKKIKDENIKNINLFKENTMLKGQSIKSKTNSIINNNEIKFKLKTQSSLKINVKSIEGFKNLLDVNNLEEKIIINKDKKITKIICRSQKIKNDKKIKILNHLKMIK